MSQIKYNIKALKDSNSQRQEIINRLAFECVNKSDEIRRLKLRIEILERFVFRTFNPSLN